MWSDNETTVDLLQFRYLAASIVKIVKTEALLPTTIGVFGDWGCGKSSLLKMVQADLASDADVMCLNFSGWLFEGYEDAKTALMGSILDAIQDQILANKTAPDKAVELLDKLRKRVNLLQLAGFAGRFALPTILGHPHLTVMAAGSDIAKRVHEALVSTKKEERLTVEDVEKLINKSPEGAENIRRNIRDFHKDFAELLKQAKIGTLVVFIDDLDRCLPDTIIETLEAIKLFLFVPGTVFVLGADERLIEYAVRQRFPDLPGTETEVGRDYLEKLIQIPVRVPPLSGAEVHSYINLLFTQLRVSPAEFDAICQHVAGFRPTNITDLSFDIESARKLLAAPQLLMDVESDLDFALQVAPVLTPGLTGNPRRTKRFLNSLLLRLAMGAERGLDLQRQVMAKLMLLEYLKPEFFKQLAGLQASQGGKVIELRTLEDGLQSKPQNIDEPRAPDAKPAPKQAQPGKPRPAVTVGTPPLLDELPAEIKPWVADAWMRNWVVSEPALSSVDLRPYFYIAHDKVGVTDGLQMRLSPSASDVLNRLLDAQEVTRGVGLARSANLSAPDAAAVFQALARRIRQADVLDDRSPVKVLFQLMTHRQELLPQLIVLFGSLPEQKMTLALPAQLYELTNGTGSAEAAKALLERWQQSSALGLGPVARQAYNRTWKSS